jgi:hypothetical protein
MPRRTGISPVLAIAAIIAAIPGCASGTAAPGIAQPRTIVADYRPIDPEMFYRIARRCGAPEGSVVVEPRRITFNAPPDLDYETGACVVAGIRATGTIHFGYAGNERFLPREEQ